MCPAVRARACVRFFARAARLTTSPCVADEEEGSQEGSTTDRC